MRISSILTACGFLLIALPAQTQSFSCGIGDRPSCLGYGDTVCSSSGKCVSQNAQCFDSYQCNYEGFTCRSNVTECVQTYEELLLTHNSLINNYNDLLATRADLRDDLRDLLEIVEDLEGNQQETQSCLIYATTLDQAQLCAR